MEISIETKKIEEYKSILYNMKTASQLEEKMCGIYAIIADAAGGKSYIMKKLAQFFKVDVINCNEPDNKGATQDAPIMKDWNDLLSIADEIGTIKMVDSMSIMDSQPTKAVAKKWADAKSGSRSEGVSPEFSATLVHTSQIYTEKRKILFFTYSLADFTDHNRMFSRILGYTNGVIWSEKRKIKVSFRCSTERDIMISTNIDELLLMTEETKPMKSQSQDLTKSPASNKKENLPDFNFSCQKLI